MLRRLLIAIVFADLFSISVNAQVGNLEFVENKGQWNASIGYKALLGSGYFYIQKKGFTVVLHNETELNQIRAMAHTGGRASGQSASVGKLKGIAAKQGAKYILHSHAYQVNFLNANENPEIVPDKPLPTYNNYFIGNDHTKWASNCKVYQGITYKNIYPNIDLRYYTNEGSLKYDLIVHPGADPNNIVMKYVGADKLSIQKNELITHTSVRNVKELAPYSYQFDQNGKKEVECKFQLRPDNTVRFKVKNYSSNATLVIDPTLIFSSFTGSRSDNWGYTATYDVNGGFYSGSIVLDESQGGQGGLPGNGFPVTTGAFQTTFQGGDGSEGNGLYYDVAIMKFDPTGASRVYATYLGGAGDEQPHSLIVDNNGNLVIAGRTSSGSSFPVTSTLYGPGGGFDIFLTVLNSTGTGLVGSRLFGGSSSDGVNYAPKYVEMNGTQSLRQNYGDDGRSEVIVDGSNNIYLASCTQSTAGTSTTLFPTSSNAFQPNPGGAQDGVFIKASNDLSTVFCSSFLGGSGDDAAFALALDPTTSDVYVGGGTASTNFPGTGSGSVVYSTNQGGVDGFVSIISNDGGTLRKSSYFGTSGYDMIYGVQFDKFSYPYIMGTTTGAWPVVNATFSQSNGKQFISKLQKDLSTWVYSTVFGKGSTYPDISPTAFLVDRCENVYVSGWGGGLENSDGYNNSGTTGLTVTPDALQSVTDGEDFYFFVLKKDAVSQLYGSFFGQYGGALGDHVDGGTSRFDKQGIIYEAICANCYGGAKFPTTPGAWATTNGTGTAGCNLAAVKIAFNFAGVAADLRSMIAGRYDSSGCVPLTVNFTDTIHNAKQYIWNFGDGTPDSPSVSNSVAHTYQNIGTYRVMLVAIDSSTCNIADTVYMDIRARNDEATLAFTGVKVPPCQSLAFQFNNNSTPPAGKPFTDSSFIWDFGDNTPRVASGLNSITHAYASAGTYIVRLILQDSNYCNHNDSITTTLRVAPIVKAQFTTPASGCAPYLAQFTNNSVAGQQFIWNFGDGTSSTDVSPTHLYSQAGNYTISLTAIDSSTCNIIDSTNFSIVVSQKPTAAFSYTPIPPVANTPDIFTNLSSGAVRYKWLFGDGDSALRTTQDTVIHQYRKTGTFQACLIAYNQYDCSDTACAGVQVIVNPVLDVPNAFTPGRFGQNSIVLVRGFGIASLTFSIYNRWGQKVFESNDPNIGWDGTFKGNPQPMDVYAYTLQATFFDGTKTSKTGNITLLR